MLCPKRMGLVNRFRLLFSFCFFSYSICIDKVDFLRHKGTVLIQYFFYTVLIAELIAVLVQVQCYFSTNCSFVRIAHFKFGAAIAFPINSFCTFLIGKCLNGHLICYHESRIKAQSEMPDDLVFICLIFIFLQKVCSSAECDLVDIFPDLVCSHTNTVINHL